VALRFDWDPAKAAKNLAKHKVSFELAEQLEIITAKVVIDDRFDYGETRFVAVGLVGTRMMVMVYTERDEDLVWVISLRKANKREIRAYVESL
jgi:uncharacterized DUF497 family protein